MPLFSKIYTYFTSSTLQDEKCNEADQIIPPSKNKNPSHPLGLSTLDKENLNASHTNSAVNDSLIFDPPEKNIVDTPASINSNVSDKNQSQCNETIEGTSHYVAELLPECTKFNKSSNVEYSFESAKIFPSTPIKNDALRKSGVLKSIEVTDSVALGNHNSSLNKLDILSDYNNDIEMSENIVTTKVSEVAEGHLNQHSIENKATRFSSNENMNNVDHKNIASSSCKISVLDKKNNSHTNHICQDFKVLSNCKEVNEINNTEISLKSTEDSSSSAKYNDKRKTCGILKSFLVTDSITLDSHSENKPNLLNRNINDIEMSENSTVTSGVTENTETKENLNENENRSSSCKIPLTNNETSCSNDAAADSKAAQKDDPIIKNCVKLDGSKQFKESDQLKETSKPVIESDQLKETFKPAKESSQLKESEPVTKSEHTSRENKSHCGLTEEMINEEEKIKSEEAGDLEEVRKRTLDELKRTGQKQRYDRLQVLLSRSNLYATYLLGRIQDREAIEKKRKEKQEKTKVQSEEKKSSASSDENSQGSQKKGTKSSNKVANKVKSKKRKANEVEDLDANEEKRQKTGNKGNGEKVEKSEEENKNDPKDGEKIDTTSECRFLNGEKISSKQPLLLTGGVMRNYQLDGMEWLRGLFEHGINGILADEMGLGKTIQSIALIASLIEHKVIGPFLIVAPLSTLPNWMSEFKKFAPEIHAVLYHGSIQDRATMRRKLMRVRKYSHGLKSLPVIVTSYEITMRDRIVLEQYNLEWKYMIVDEGHRIKNLNCKLIRELKLYKTANRLLLTGTPLQNNLAELWSLLNFLLPDIFDDLNSFQSWFDFSAVDDNEQLIAQEQEAKVLQTLHSILTPFLLRRLKTDVDLSIPPKKEVLVYAPLTPKQEEFYKTTLDRTILDTLTKKNKVEEPVEYTASGRARRSATKKVKYREIPDDDSEFDLDMLVKEVEDQEKRIQEFASVKKKEDRKSVINIRLQNILMQLRKCCNHPYLLEYPFNSETEELIIDERLVECSGKMLLLDRMLPELKKTGHKVLIFSQMNLMLDIIADYCGIRKYKFSRIDGSMSIQERQISIESFNEDPETFIFLLSTRAGGLGLNLMSADTCIIYDSDWNPQADLQAQDRCHRIGQKKPVVVYRFVTANTVDERIIERAASKRKLEKMVIHKKNFKGRGFASAISPKELLELLQSKDVSSTVDGNNIISDEHLNQLLDRTDMLACMKANSKLKQAEKEEKEKVTDTQASDVNNNIETNDDTSKKIFKVLDANDNEDIMF